MSIIIWDLRQTSINLKMINWLSTLTTLVSTHKSWQYFALIQMNQLHISISINQIFSVKRPWSTSKIPSKLQSKPNEVPLYASWNNQQVSFGPRSIGGFQSFISNVWRIRKINTNLLIALVDALLSDFFVVTLSGFFSSVSSPSQTTSVTGEKKTT